MNFSGGDFRFFWPFTLNDLMTIPQSWDSFLNTGIGKNSIDTIWITSYLNLTSTLNMAGLSWGFIGLFFWMLPALVLCFVSAFILAKSFFHNANVAFISGLIYLINSYFLLIFLGGQIGVAISYAIAPLVIFSWIKIIESKVSLKRILVFGLITSAQVLFDPRITYITFVGLLIFTIVRSALFKKFSFSWLVSLFAGLLIVFLVHLYWILPLFFYGGGITAGLSNSNTQFFSFAFFENSFSLLHPNWPENIFGKVGFQRPEFLIFPLIAYSSLLFLKGKKKSEVYIICSLVIVTLVGAFLSKGFNEPFRSIYPFLLNNLPGFSLFRDPTKWYLLIVLGFSLLIPYSLLNIIEKLKKFGNVRYVVPFVFISFFIVTFIPIKSINNSIFEKREIPRDYQNFYKLVSSQDQYFRTLWIPQWQRYGYFSVKNPAIGRNELLKSASSSSQINELKKIGNERLSDWNIKYIVVPYDSESEIFLDDRKYDNFQYNSAINELKNIKWLSEVDGFDILKVFEINNFKDRFWSEKEGLIKSFSKIEPNRYRINLQNAQRGDIVVFSEEYDGYWFAINENDKNNKRVGNVISSTPFKRELNSFTLRHNGTYAIEVFYLPQRYVGYGLIVSTLSFVLCLSLLIYSYKRK